MANCSESQYLSRQSDISAFQRKAVGGGGGAEGWEDVINVPFLSHVCANFQVAPQYKDNTQHYPIDLSLVLLQAGIGGIENRFRIFYAHVMLLMPNVDCCCPTDVCIVFSRRVNKLLENETKRQCTTCQLILLDNNCPLRGNKVDLCRSEPVDSY